MTINELIKLIEQWARDRELDKNGTIEGQLIKTAEEMAELIIAISKDNIENIKDSIGDVFVTLVVGNLLDLKFDICDIYEVVSDKSFMSIRRKYDLIHFATQKIYDLTSAERYSKTFVGAMIENLHDICDWYELDFVECVEAAYSEIAGRKGKIVDGTFVKESVL